MEYLEAYSIISTTFALAFAYLWYRRNEVISLAVEVIDAATDKKITEEEFQKIVDRLRAVIYKK